MTDVEAPILPGYTYLRQLGAGGYARVYLYREHDPERDVAVKILNERAENESARQRFTSEANLMASLSTHPYIVTIYRTGVAPDGRSYLAMEHYSQPNLSRRLQDQPLSVPEVLEVGVHIAGALETAHRAGIVHRDIKPANILTSEYGRPGLTDFGIASVGSFADEGAGLSIPWASPEVIDLNRTIDVRSDVYSLAATLHTLLVGRSPFAVPGERNDLALMDRIRRQPAPPTGRADVSGSLERLLAQGMAKDPDHRPSTAEGFARALNAIEIEMRLPATPISMKSIARPAALPDTDDDPATRAKGIRVIDSLSSSSGVSAPPSEAPSGSPLIGAVPLAPNAFAAPALSQRVPVLPEEEGATVVRPVSFDLADATPGVEDLPDSGLPVRVIIAAVAVVLVIGAVVVSFALSGSKDTASTDCVPPACGVRTVPSTAAPPSTPLNLAVAVADGIATVSWTPLAAEELGKGGYYRWTRTDDGATPEQQQGFNADAPPVTIAAIAPGDKICVSVSAIRASGSQSTESEMCGANP